MEKETITPTTARQMDKSAQYCKLAIENIMEQLNQGGTARVIFGGLEINVKQQDGFDSLEYRVSVRDLTPAFRKRRNK